MSIRYYLNLRTYSPNDFDCSHTSLSAHFLPFRPYIPTELSLAYYLAMLRLAAIFRTDQCRNKTKSDKNQFYLVLQKKKIEWKKDNYKKVCKMKWDQC